MHMAYVVMYQARDHEALMKAIIKHKSWSTS